MSWIKVKAKNRAGEEYMKIVWHYEQPVEQLVTITPVPVTVSSTKPSKKVKK